MAKIIIEVDDDFIRESASSAALLKRMDESEDKVGFAKVLFDLFAYKGINERIENGETEFHVTRDMMDDDKKLKYWDSNIADVLMLAVMADSEKKKED